MRMSKYGIEDTFIKEKFYKIVEELLVNNDDNQCNKGQVRRSK